MEVYGNRKCLVTNILQNITFYVPQKKDSHTGLKGLEINDHCFKFKLDLFTFSLFISCLFNNEELFFVCVCVIINFCHNCYQLSFAFPGIEPRIFFCSPNVQK